MKKAVSIALILLLTASVTGCKKESDDQTLNVAIQYGIAYAPLEYIKLNQIADKYNLTIHWIQVNNPTEISDGMISGAIDIGFMGPAPALLGIDKGMEWKIFTGLSSNEVAIVTDRDYVFSLSDFKPEDRIAVLTPSCTQAVLLSLASLQQLSNADYFANRIVSMSHPDALNALVAQTEVAAHIATPPYIQTELDHGMRVIATGREILGEPFTFIVGVASESCYNTKSHSYQLFIEVLKESIDSMNQDLNAAAEQLAPVYDLQKDSLLAQMRTDGESIYSTRLTGIEAFSDAMLQTGYLKSKINRDQIVYPINAGLQ